MKESITIEQMELHAYVDGQLSAEARRRVETYLETHPEARQQIADYQVLNAQIKSLYDPVADEPVPVNYIQTRSRRDFWPPACPGCSHFSAGPGALHRSVSGGRVGSAGCSTY